MNYPAKKDPFLEDNDDDFSFASKSRQGGAYGGSSTGGYNPWEEPQDDYSRPKSEAEQKQEFKENAMNRQLESTQRMLSSIYDSERVGIATAEELARQGEQLDNIERKTQQINNDMKATQRNLNSIKSVFGGIKNWWSGGDKSKEATPASTASSSRPDNRRLAEAVRQSEEHSSRPENHPAMRLRSGDVRGFYDDDQQGDDLDDAFMRGARGAGGGTRSATSNQAGRGGAGGASSQKQLSAFDQYDRQFNENVDSMSDGMARLKMLALGLGDEIESQNDQIENRILPGVERADQNIRDQNRQMKRILGVKK